MSNEQGLCTLLLQREREMQTGDFSPNKKLSARVVGGKLCVLEAAFYLAAAKQTAGFFCVKQQTRSLFPGEVSVESSCYGCGSNDSVKALDVHLVSDNVMLLKVAVLFKSACILGSMNGAGGRVHWRKTNLTLFLSSNHDGKDAFIIRKRSCSSEQRSDIHVDWVF